MAKKNLGTLRGGGHNQIVKCKGCGKMTHSSIDGCLDVCLCRVCFEKVNRENEHSDGYHEENPDSECPECVKAGRVIDEAKEKAGISARAGEKASDIPSENQETARRNGRCGCGCGMTPKGKKSSFIRGHYRKLVGWGPKSDVKGGK